MHILVAESSPLLLVVLHHVMTLSRDQVTTLSGGYVATSSREQCHYRHVSVFISTAIESNMLGDKSTVCRMCALNALS